MQHIFLNLDNRVKTLLGFKESILGLKETVLFHLNGVSERIIRDTYEMSCLLIFFKVLIWNRKSYTRAAKKLLEAMLLLKSEKLGRP